MYSNSETTLFASGDYLLDDHQRELYTSIERLQEQMTNLKDKLEQEKILLMELKAETQYFSTQCGISAIPDEYQPSAYEGSQQTYSNISQVSAPLTVSPFQETDKELCRLEYMKKLQEIDALCKKEMNMVNTVVETMEPLKQMANDWNLEIKMKEICDEPCLSEEVEAEKDGTIANGAQLVSYVGTASLVKCTYSHTGVFPYKQDRNCVMKPIVMGDCDTNHQSLEASDRNGEDSKKYPSKNKQGISKTDLHLDSTGYPSCSDLTSINKKNLDDSLTSEDSLTSLEVLKDNILYTSPNVSRCGSRHDVSTDDDSGIIVEDTLISESRSAISLASIQQAFAEHKKWEKSGEQNTDFYDYLTKEGAEEAERLKKEQEAIMKKLNPTARKLIRNWTMKEKPVGLEESVVLTLNKNIFKEGESLCAEDVVNRFLYRGEGYEYAPLFASDVASYTTE